VSEALITTKLSVPPLRRKLVHRPYLLGKLSQGSESGFILISAPAGYGKTTLLSAWIAKIDYDYAWLSLDPADNDLARFLRYLAAALG
jgi:LuxR family maltose regulon positive regulatory protein